MHDGVRTDYNKELRAQGVGNLLCGFAGGLPLGLQLIGRAFDEPTLLRAAAVLERAAGFSARPGKE